MNENNLIPSEEVALIKERFKKDRGVKVLELLRRHGPLSFRGLYAMMEPEIKARRLHDAIARLNRKGLVVKRNPGVFRGAGTFYQITQDEKIHLKLSSILKCTAKELQQPYVRNPEFLHSETCALWSHLLSKTFPEAKIVRDFEFRNYPDAYEVLLIKRYDFSCNPDILMVFEGEDDGKRGATIAFEIERSRKSKPRLRAKLKKLASETLLDGVVYLCNSQEIREPIQQIYKAGVMKSSIGSS